MTDIVSSLASFIVENSNVKEVKEMLLAAEACNFNAVSICCEKGITLAELTTGLKLALSRME